MPTNIRSIDDLEKWPVIDKAEMIADAAEHPPYGTYTTVTDEVWAKRGWMMFSSSGSTGAPRVFRYTHADREAWAWANARALLAMGFKPGETVFMMTGYGPHVWAWGVQYALEKMELPTIPGGGMDAKAASPHVGGYSYPAQQRGTSPAATHLMEDIQVWEVVDPDTRRALQAGQRGLTVCTNLNLESSPQLRFLVGDYTSSPPSAARAAVLMSAPSARLPVAPTI